MNTRRASARTALAAGVLAAAFALVGCTPAVTMEPADDADDPACADVVVRLPDAVADYAQRETNAQSTGAWGDPAVLLLTCGVDVPAASALPCIDYNGIFWLRDDSSENFYVFTTYGRDPAVDLVFERDAFLSAGIPLDVLSRAVSTLPKNGRICTDLDDTVTGQELVTPSPSPSDGPPDDPSASPEPQSSTTP